MRTAMKYLGLVLLICTIFFSASTPAVTAESDEEILIGRIAHLEGQLLRYLEEGKDWAVTVEDAPFGLTDTLYSGNESKAEFIMPNETWIRVGESTQIQLIAMNPDATTLDVASGLARLYNKSNNTLIKVTTPFGYVVAPGNTVFDLYVGDESLEVIAVRGTIDFVHDGTKAKYEVKEGSSSIIADKNEIALGNGMVEAAWDDWNGQRDGIWAERLEVRGYSADFLPEPIREESYALEENGRWERVIYDGAYRDMWRPTGVDPGWRPFSVGRWTMYYGDNCWIPDEPFGYVTHHYGSWVFVESFRAWYWAPPAVRPRVGVPSITIGFGWYPGRVGWIHSGGSVGWVPLTPTEAYYGHRHWGHHTRIVGRSPAVTINIGQYRHLDQAVIIDRDHFYRGTRYTPHLQRNVNRTTLVNNYKPSTVINTTVINNLNTDKRRFFSNDAEVVRKPHVTVLKRIDSNQQLGRDAKRISRRGMEQDLTRINTVAQPVQKSAVRPLRLTNHLVEADKVAQPLNEVSFPQKEIKPKDRERQLSPENRPSLERQGRSTRERGQFDQGPGVTGQDASQRIRAPRETGTQGSEQVDTPQRQDRQQLPSGPQLHEQPRSSQDLTQEPQRPQDQPQRHQQEEAQRQEIQQRRQQEMQQQEQAQRQQQVEAQRQQQQEIQQRRQQEMQQQQEQNQRRQQVEAQRQQQQEIQQRRQQEMQQQQEQNQRRQQAEAQRQQQQEIQQRQQQQPQQQQGRQRHQPKTPQEIEEERKR